MQQVCEGEKFKFPNFRVGEKCVFCISITGDRVKWNFWFGESGKSGHIDWVFESGKIKWINIS